jgi:predicted ribosomally synthesized peptide with nif11-like leader
MSKEHADSFLQAIDENPELYQQMAKIRDQMQKETMALAKEHGYELTPKELKAALEDKLGTELPDIAENGGADPTTCVVPFSEAPGR